MMIQTIHHIQYHLCANQMVSVLFQYQLPIENSNSEYLPQGRPLNYSNIVTDIGIVNELDKSRDILHPVPVCEQHRNWVKVEKSPSALYSLSVVMKNGETMLTSFRITVISCMLTQYCQHIHLLHMINK